jgi:hypothetical protein
MRSCSSSVLVYESAEQVTPVYLGGMILAGKGWFDGWIRRLQPERPVWAMGVVVLDVDPKDLEVAGDDPGGLLTQERPPSRGCATRDGVESMTAEGSSDRGCRDFHPKAQGFSPDAPIAPARVLPRQADDQLLDSSSSGGRPRSTTRVAPCAGDQPPVPAHQGLGPDEEARPARPRQDTADGGEQGPVGRLQRRSGSLAVEDGELLAQDKDLKILGGITAGERGEELMERHSVR